MGPGLKHVDWRCNKTPLEKLNLLYGWLLIVDGFLVGSSCVLCRQYLLYWIGQLGIIPFQHYIRKFQHYKRKFVDRWGAERGNWWLWVDWKEWPWGGIKMSLAEFLKNRRPRVRGKLMMYVFRKRKGSSWRGTQQKMHLNCVTDFAETVFELRN